MMRADQRFIDAFGRLCDDPHITSILRNMRIRHAAPHALTLLWEWHAKVEINFQILE